MLADLELARRQRGEREPLRSAAAVTFEIFRLGLESDAFGALVLYRIGASARRRRIPLIPGITKRAAMVWAQLCIDDRAVIHPGVFVPHGQVVIDGPVEIHRGARLRPSVTISGRPGETRGPILHEDVKVGTGAAILGPCTIGSGAEIGANAVVTDDVAPGAVVAGSPARVVG